MRILFIHQNFPGQFKNLAPALVAQGHDVLALKMSKNTVEERMGVRVRHYMPTRSSTPGIHPWILDLETKAIRAEAVFHCVHQLNLEGYVPDIIIAHPGWGESLFLKEVWPHAKLGLYCEFYYRAQGADVGFDPEFANFDPAEVCRHTFKNVNNLMHEEIADAGISPTYWQANTYPAEFRTKISVIHDGIDTDNLVPNPNVTLTLSNEAGSLTLTKKDEVITFVNRNIEPYRGYHIFMRALPEILARRPNAHVLIVGGDGVSYGAAAPNGKTWLQIFLDEVKPRIPTDDLRRVRFLGHIPYHQFVPLLQLSTLHIYLTYPFVLSWSLLEAMSVGCAILASDTAPLHEAIKHNETGRLVDFFDANALAEQAIAMLQDPEERARLGANARLFAQQHYDLKKICLPQQLAWVDRLAAS